MRFVRAMSRRLITEVVRVDTAPIRFATSQNYVEVSVPESMQLTVNKEMKHDPSCGAMQWFKPFSTLEHVGDGSSRKPIPSAAPVSERNGALQTSVQRSSERSALLSYALRRELQRMRAQATFNF